jgi:hypothetical protein
MLAYNALQCATNNAYAYSQQWYDFRKRRKLFKLTKA